MELKATSASNKGNKKDQYYLDIAETVSEKSTCVRRRYGAIIVKNDEIISTGYNGAPRGCPNCAETGCLRAALGTRKGDAYNLCVSVHAEQNAIISARRRDMIGATLYIVGVQATYDEHVTCYADPTPCLLCHRMIINAGIDRVVGRVADEYGVVRALDLDVSCREFMSRIHEEYSEEIERMEVEIREATLRGDPVDELLVQYHHCKNLLNEQMAANFGGTIKL